RRRRGHPEDRCAEKGGRRGAVAAGPGYRGPIETPVGLRFGKGHQLRQPEDRGGAAFGNLATARWGRRSGGGGQGGGGQGGGGQGGGGQGGGGQGGGRQGACGQGACRQGTGRQSEAAGETRPRRRQGGRSLDLYPVHADRAQGRIRPPARAGEQG